MATLAIGFISVITFFYRSSLGADIGVAVFLDKP
jgi:hypothetical protein